MSVPMLTLTRRHFNEEVDRLSAAGYRPTPDMVPSDPNERAEFYRQQFEQERVRLAKLWVLFRDLGAEVEALRAEIARPPAPTTIVAVPTRRPRRRSRAFHYGKYTLYAAKVANRGGGRRKIYFFAKGRPKSGRATAKPAGYEVKVTKRSGLPVLRRSGRTRRTGATSRRRRR